MRTVQISVQLPDSVESLDALEGLIDAKGQQIKQQLFEHEVGHLIEQEQSDTSDVPCPCCEKKSPKGKGINRVN